MLITKYDYKPLSRKEENGARHYVLPDGSKVASVTTILDKTKPEDKKETLNNWRKRMGNARATEITTEAASVGTALHLNLEKFVRGTNRQPGNNAIHLKANAMADIIIAHGLSRMTEVWGIEQSLYFPELYAGTTDLIGIYDGNPCICDYKQSNRKKKEEYVEDYRLQLVAYILAHNEVYGTDIKEGHIFMCTRGNDTIKVGGEEYQQFDLLPKDFNKYQDMWLDRVEKYYLDFS